MSLDIDKIYRRCVRGAGVLGTTVQKVDDGAHFVVLYEFILTTRTLYRSTYNYSPLEGPIPCNVPSSLHNKRRKQGIIHSEKIIASPEGLGVGGKLFVSIFIQNLIISRGLCPARQGFESAARVALHTKYSHDT
jgi:hypothetical protein